MLRRTTRVPKPKRAPPGGHGLQRQARSTTSTPFGPAALALNNHLRGILELQTLCGNAAVSRMLQAHRSKRPQPDSPDVLAVYEPGRAAEQRFDRTVERPDAVVARRTAKPAGAAAEGQDHLPAADLLRQSQCRLPGTAQRREQRAGRGQKTWLQPLPRASR
jgi:hypothetical protein